MGVLRWTRWTAIGIVALLVLGFGVGTIAKRAGSRSSDSAGPAVRGAPALERSVGDAVTSGMGTGVTEAYAVRSANTGAVAEFPDRIVKTGDISLKLKRGGFDAAWQRAVEIARAVGGYVASSSRGSQKDRLAESREPAAGDITIRVPANRFEDALARLSNVGTVTSNNVTSSDVTQEFVDLESRLRNQRAQQAVLIRLMAQAKNVSETLAVQQQLSQTQEQIEQITGRINVLRKLTELSAISVHLFEPGAAGAPTPDGPSFTEAWETALEGLVRIGTVALIAGVWLAPFAIIAAAILFSRRRVRTESPVV